LHNLFVETKFLDDNDDKVRSFSISVDGIYEEVSYARYADIIHSARSVRGFMSDIKNGFIGLAHKLGEIHRRSFYVGNFYEFVEKQFGICHSTCRKLFAVCREFSSGDGQIKAEYSDYSYSQLENMVPLSPLERKDIKPTMTVAEIKNYKRNKFAISKVADVRQSVQVPEFLKDDCLLEVDEVIGSNDLESKLPVDEDKIVLLYSQELALGGLKDRIRIWAGHEFHWSNCIGLLFDFMKTEDFLLLLEKYVINSHLYVGGL